jgi:hypothetical protein
MSNYYFFLYIYTDVVEEKLTNVDIIDKYYKILFHLCTYGNLVSKQLLLKNIC